MNLDDLVEINLKPFKHWEMKNCLNELNSLHEISHAPKFLMVEVVPTTGQELRIIAGEGLGWKTKAFYH